MIRKSEAQRIRARYAHLFADCAGARPVAEVVEVGSVDALVRLAGRYGVALRHHHDDRTGRDLFFVDHNDVRYRYRTLPKRGYSAAASTKVSSR